MGLRRILGDYPGRLPLPKGRLADYGRRAALRARFPRRDPTLVRLGSAECGWRVPPVRADWVCCTVGVGEDASFDVALAEAGCQVIAVDPTPRALEHIAPLAASRPRLRVAPYAVWPTETELRFYPPANPADVSHSAVNMQNTIEPIVVPARPLPQILEEFGFDHADLVKLDIEGAEYAVLDTLDVSRVDVLCVEFHRTAEHGFRAILAAVRSLSRHGFRVAHTTGADFTFVRG